MVFPNPDRIVTSHKVFEITELGKQQIEALKSSLSGIKFDLFLTSPLDRAVKTITPIYAAFKEQNPNLRLITMKDWEEVNMGHLDGKTPKAIQDLFAEHFPGAVIPKDFNDCMNTVWPAIDGKQIIFEIKQQIFCKFTKI